MTSSVTFKRHHAIEERIEWLGKLNDRRIVANANGDMQDLEKVAREYELLARPCLTMAREIRIAIRVRVRHVASAIEYSRLS